MKSFGFLLSSLAMVVMGTLAFTTLPSPSSPFSRQTTMPIATTSSTRFTTAATTTTSLNFGPFSAPKDDGTPGDYVCKDCGYVYTKGPKAWAALSDDYSCPPCGAPKRRFKKVPKGSASGKVEVKKNWFGK